MNIHITGLDLDYADRCEYLDGNITDTDCDHYMFDVTFSDHEIRTASNYILITQRATGEAIVFHVSEFVGIAIE